MSPIPLFAFLIAQAVQPASSRSIDPSALGPAVGQPIPGFEARDQDGQSRGLSSLMGPNGLVLVFHRSADW